MENLKLSIRIDEGRFQIWEEMEDGKFFCCEDILNNTIQHPQELAYLIQQAITDPHLLFNQFMAKGLIDDNGMPTVITISDDEVLFTRGNIVKVFWDKEARQLVMFTNDDSCYFFKDSDAVRFLNHFPYSYFEKAKTLAEIYKFNLPN